jgi:glycosyltransferase involved in cell wall biosynthesis
MPLTVLNVAYPFAAVGPDAVGGAEQVVSQLDRALVAAGHRSLVVARGDSEIAGLHLAVPRAAGPIDEAARERAWRHHRQAILAALRNWPVDLVHLHGVDFASYLPPPGVRALVTLHLPPAWYPSGSLEAARPGLHFHCVSSAQHRACASMPSLLPPIPNGVALERFASRHAKRRFALLLACICPEKGVHVALEAASRAETPLLIGGEVFPYPAHERYFREEVALRLQGAHRYLGPVGLRRKRRLLAAARCLLVPSLAAETSSLVAMEAIASGTPVIAFRRGALPEIVDHGRSGWLVDDAAAMADAIRRADRIPAAECRAIARARFPLARTIDGYFRTYRRLAEAKEQDDDGASRPRKRALG